MSDNLTDPLWGTGYGSKRHLVDMATMGRAVNCIAFARCVSMNPPRLDFLADRYGDLEHVASRPPCARCLKIAAKEARP